MLVSARDPNCEAAKPDASMVNVAVTAPEDVQVRSNLAAPEEPDVCFAGRLKKRKYSRRLVQRKGAVEFYLSVTDLVDKIPNTIGLIFIPIFVFTILAEAIVIQSRHGNYSWKSTGVSSLLAIGHILTQAAAHGLIFGVIAAGVFAVRLTTIPISWDNWLSLIALFLLTDFAFYVEHRCSHRIRLMWASHSVHHSTEQMVVAAAFRLAWTPILSGVFLFYLPIVWIGYDPVWVFGMASASLTYQFFVHTELVKRIGWLDWIINTPSAHRVHHASNPEYIDKNFGGELMIWDHLFGTYQPELPHVKIRYGLSHARSSATNAFVIAYEELWQILKDIVRAPSWRERFRSVSSGRPKAALLRRGVATPAF